MTKDNAELIQTAGMRRLAVSMAVGIEDVAYDGGWGSALAASAADVPLLLDALKDAGAERDAAKAAALEEAAAWLDSGELCSIVAYDGPSNRAEVVAAYDEALEDPAAWLRARAAEYRAWIARDDGGDLSAFWVLDATS